MISKCTIIAFTCALLTICESAFVDTLTKCEVDDKACLKELTQKMFIKIAPTGVPEYNIPPYDPLELKGIKVPILGLLTITIEEGTARGIKDCVFNKFNVNIKKGYLSMALTCDLDVDVKVKLGDINEVIQNTLGTKAIEGSGSAKLKLDKLHIKIKYFYDIVKRDDGKIYIDCKPEEAVYDYEVGDAKILLEKLFIGGVDVAKQVNGILQPNTKVLVSTFGSEFFKVAKNVVADIVHAIFDKTSTDHFISTDLSPHVKNA
ncbi:juvenile hormone-binding protein [Bicyclus anynana]|uniref:Juvenile hormone-binding protein n=1 Tax=Bicyclus anynana TaxID=110368 RepID=A0A6J1MG28_BICAN|nr:juvenile hormone-binding protein [Bicyclus anynana]